MNMRSTRYTHHMHTHTNKTTCIRSIKSDMCVHSLSRSLSLCLSPLLLILSLSNFSIYFYFFLCMCRKKQRKWNDQKRMANKTKLQSIGARLRNEDEPLKRKIRNNRTKKKKTNKLIRTVQDIVKWNTMFSLRMAFLSCKTFPNSIFLF